MCWALCYACCYQDLPRMYLPLGMLLLIPSQYLAIWMRTRRTAKKAQWAIISNFTTRAEGSCWGRKNSNSEMDQPNPPQKANRWREKVTTTGVKRQKSEKVGKVNFTFLPRKQKWTPFSVKPKSSIYRDFANWKLDMGLLARSSNRIGATETAECWWCGDAEQSVIHLYTKCRKWRAERRVLRKSLGSGFNGKGGQKRDGWQNY